MRKQDHRPDWDQGSTVAYPEFCPWFVFIFVFVFAIANVIVILIVTLALIFAGEQYGVRG